MSESVLIVIALGVMTGMIFYWRTGISCGGIITPGVLALSLNQPLMMACSLALSFVVWVMLELLSRVFTLYGRQRIALAMFMALVIRILMGQALLDPILVGWAIPGLIAADFQRQGVFITLGAALSNAIVAAVSFYALSMFLRWVI